VKAFAVKAEAQVLEMARGCGAFPVIPELLVAISIRKRHVQKSDAPN
jgi:hypothetical protein